VDGNGLPVKASPAGLDWLYRGLAWEPELSVYRSTDWLFQEDIGFYDPHTARTLNSRFHPKKQKQWLPSNFRLWIDGPNEAGSRVREKATSGLKDTLKTQVRMAGARKLLDRGEAGDNVGLLLRATKKEEGGRHTPFRNKYRPQFYFRTADRKLLDRGEAGDNVGLLLRANNVPKIKHDTVKNSIGNIR
jgi:hypothetical protein